jgi:vacuole morphology and inheritance protein 14
MAESGKSGSNASLTAAAAAGASGGGGAGPQAAAQLQGAQPQASMASASSSTSISSAGVSTSSAAAVIRGRELSQLTLRNLCDRAHDKRKQATVEVEQFFKELLQIPGAVDESRRLDPATVEKVRSTLASLANGYAFNAQSALRKGGLLGLAAAAIGLQEQAAAFLPQLLPPVLKCFQDMDARVRFHACEALYNIAKVARGSLFFFFNEIFDGLCRLYSDAEADVKAAALQLDRLMKDLVSENEAFDLRKFIPLLKERIRIRDPYTRQLLVGWITVLDSVPSIDMLEFLPEYLGGLFEMLSDPIKDIRQQAYAALAGFLREIVKQSAHVDLKSMTPLLVQQCDANDNLTRLTALSWLYEFIQLGRTQLLPQSAALLGAGLRCISDSDAEIRAKAEATNAILLQLLETTSEAFEIEPLLAVLTQHIGSQSVGTRMAALRWINMLLTKLPDVLLRHVQELFPALMQTLSDVEEQVVRLDLDVLGRIAFSSKNIDLVLQALLQQFSSDRKLLEARCSLIVRQLSVALKGEVVFRALARLLLAHADLEFASLMVQTLSLILLTSAELFELRAVLKETLVSPRSREVFVELYRCWCHNPVATLTLCLLAQTYELASAVAFQLADLEVTVGFLMQLDKLVQLIESPIFIHTRLQLLEPQRHPFLLKSLYAVLMMLPQSSAFAALKTRLESVAPLALLQAHTDSKVAVSSDPQRHKDFKALDHAALLEQFRVVQEQHRAHRKRVARQQALPGGGNAAAAADDKKADG